MAGICRVQRVEVDATELTSSPRTSQVEGTRSQHRCSQSQGSNIVAVESDGNATAQLRVLVDVMHIIGTSTAPQLLQAVQARYLPTAKRGFAQFTTRRRDCRLA